MVHLFISVFFIAVVHCELYQSAPEPFPPLSNYDVGPAVPDSPDPLVAYSWRTETNFTNLQIYTLKPVDIEVVNSTAFVNAESLLTDKPLVTVQGKGSIMLVYAQENPAWLEFDSSDYNPAMHGAVILGVSEYNEMWMISYNNAKQGSPKKYGSTYRLELNSELYEGVKYAWINTTTTNGNWHITGLRLVCQAKPVSYKGKFNSNDALLNKVWYTGAYTVRTNLLVDYFGAILMYRGDRISWTGDAHVAQAAALVAFANYDSIKQNILRTKSDSNGIESYATYWVLSVCDYTIYTGDKQFLIDMMPYITSNMEHARQIYNHPPNLVFFGWDDRLGSGFKDPNCLEATLDYQMLVIRVFSDVADVLEAFNLDNDTVTQYRQIAKNFIAQTRSDPNWYTKMGIHAASDAVNAGFTTAQEQAAIYQLHFQDVVNLCSFSSFNMYWILQALGRMDKTDQANYVIRKCWGGMVNLGATTYWEIYSPEWDPWFSNDKYLPEKVPNGENGWTSLCHPWSAGATYWMTKNMLGVVPTTPGFATFDVTPMFGDLRQMDGVVPTPHGDIEVNFNLESGENIVVVPQGTIGRVGLVRTRFGCEEAIQIVIDGKLFHLSQGISPSLEKTEDYIYVLNVQPGLHIMNVKYTQVSSCMPAADPFPPATYPGKFIGLDSTTKGNWVNKYGKLGYSLLYFTNNGAKVEKLPPFVQSVMATWDEAKQGKFPAPTPSNDSRGLLDPNSNTGARNIGVYYSDLTFVIDIKMYHQTSYLLSIYCVDWDFPNGFWIGGGGKGRRQIVRIMDLDTLNVVIPSQVVRDFSGGVYLTFEYNSSMRLRFSTIGGDNAVVSALFWD